MATEIRALIEEGAAHLRRAADDPRREAELLLAAALGRSRASLLANPEERIVDCDATDRYESHVTRRAIGEPVAYVLGEKEFWSLPLAGDTTTCWCHAGDELVVERARAHLPRTSKSGGCSTSRRVAAPSRSPSRTSVRRAGYSGPTCRAPRLRLRRRMRAGSALRTRGSKRARGTSPPARSVST